MNFRPKNYRSRHCIHPNHEKFIIFLSKVLTSFVQKKENSIMKLFRFFENVFLVQFAQSKFSIRTNSMKPFHCTGRACDGQSLFGECPMSHPFVFDQGQQCCTLNLDAEDKARETLKK